MKQSIWREKHYPMLVAWLLAILVLTGVALSMSNEFLHNRFVENLPAAVQIKTQQAADRIEGGIRGIDVSKWQGDINWSQVAQDNVKFAFIRATYGTEIDPTFVTNAQQAHTNGIRVGAYHYATFKDRATMLQEAKAFVEQLKKVTITYPVVLDLEVHRGLSKSKLTDLAVEFLDYINKAGYSAMFYSYENFYNHYMDHGRLAPYPLWVANYIERPKSLDHQIWQHTSYGQVKGIKGRVDINIAYRDLSPQRQVRVSKEISDSIKLYLNETYNAGIDVAAPLDYAVIEHHMQRGLQTEVNRQLGGNVPVTGELRMDELASLGSIAFHSGTKGNITRLVQCRLFYMGYYTEAISGNFDSHTVEALYAFQRDNLIAQTGTVDWFTWQRLFPVDESQ